MAHTSATVKELIKLGGNIRITGTYTPAALKEFAKLSKANGTRLTIKANSQMPSTLKELVKIGGDLISIEL